MMREDNLLCLRRRKFVVTTDSDHKLPVYPNLAREMVLTGIDQLWVADITYIRLETEFVYLAVVLDAFSRKVIGWALDRTLEATLTVEALADGAAATRKPARRTGAPLRPRRAVRIGRLHRICSRAHGIQISMSRKGNPYDNAKCESFMKTLKYEEVYRTNTGTWPTRAPGSARFWKGLQPQTPAFGAGLSASRQVRGATDGKEYGGGCAATDRMSFSRHRRSIHPMWRTNREQAWRPLPALIGPDESQPDIPWRGWSPPWPRLRFTGCAQNALHWSCRSTNLQRTANSVLFGCLSQGVHPTFHW